MNLDNISKEELKLIIREIVREALEEKKTSRKKISSKHYSNIGTATEHSNHLENLIGSIPFILLDKTIFEKNIDVIEFAKRIGVIIPMGDKRKLDEIVGRIIVAIKDFPPARIKQLNDAISTLKIQTKPNARKDKKSFFEEWDKVIKNM